jgi:uncharacterized membrane protein YhaH (DUF805 family)
MSWFLAVVQKYAVFQGRARRKEFWMFYLFLMIFMTAVMILDLIIGSYPVIMILFTLALFVPYLAVTVRRLHDIGKSGAWFFISLIPTIGAIWLLILLATEGTRGDNQYGPDPKGF